MHEELRAAGMRVSRKCVALLKRTECLVARHAARCRAATIDSDHGGLLARNTLAPRRRELRREIAELLQAPIDNHPHERVYVLWENSGTHQDDEVKAVVRGTAERLVLLYLPRRGGAHMASRTGRSLRSTIDPKRMLCPRRWKTRPDCT
jgi:hypothetical protein